MNKSETNWCWNISSHRLYITIAALQSRSGVLVGHLIASRYYRRRRRYAILTQPRHPRAYRNKHHWLPLLIVHLCQAEQRTNARVLVAPARWFLQLENGYGDDFCRVASQRYHPFSLQPALDALDSGYWPFFVWGTRIHEGDNTLELSYITGISTIIWTHHLKKISKCSRPKNAFFSMS